MIHWRAFIHYAKKSENLKIRYMGSKIRYTFEVSFRIFAYRISMKNVCQISTNEGLGLHVTNENNAIH